jgi:hypothetical protein
VGCTAKSAAGCHLARYRARVARLFGDVRAFSLGDARRAGRQAGAPNKFTRDLQELDDKLSARSFAAITLQLLIGTWLASHSTLL